MSKSVDAIRDPGFRELEGDTNLRTMVIDQNFDSILQSSQDSEEKPDYNAISKFIRFAVEYDKMEVIEFFLNGDIFLNEEIFGPDFRSKLAGEVLSKAARFYKTDLIDDILNIPNRGFSIDQLNLRDETALYLVARVARFNQPNSIRYLCKKGANVNYEAEPSRMTPIQAAIEEFGRSRKNLDNIRTLIECCANVNADVYYGKNYQFKSTLLCHTIAQEKVLDTRSLEAAILLINAPAIDVNRAGIDGLTPLHFAAKYAKNLIDLLLLKGANASVNVPDDNGCTPLHIVASNEFSITRKLSEDQERHYEIFQQETQDALNAIRLLIEAGAEVNAQDKEDGLTPLHYAARSGQVDIVKYLIDECHANVNATDKNNETALHHAARSSGQVDIVKYLIDECHANVNATNKNNETALYLAAFAGDLAAVRFLIGRGADINIKNSEGRRPIDYAKELLANLDMDMDIDRKINSPYNNMEEIIKLLEEKEIEEGRRSPSVPQDPSGSGIHGDIEVASKTEKPSSEPQDPSGSRSIIVQGGRKV